MLYLQPVEKDDHLLEYVVKFKVLIILLILSSEIIAQNTSENIFEYDTVYSAFSKHECFDKCVVRKLKTGNIKNIPTDSNFYFGETLYKQVVKNYEPNTISYYYFIDGYRLYYAMNGECLVGFGMYKQTDSIGKTLSFLNNDLYVYTEGNDSLRNGKYVVYHSTFNNPQNIQIVAISGQHFENKMVGEWRYYNEDGSIQIVKNYNDQGLAHGYFIFYHRNGQPSHLMAFENGYRHGWTYIFNQNGNIQSQEKYENDVLIETKNFE